LPIGLIEKSQVYIMTKVHLCPRCKERLDRIEYDDGCVEWNCICSFRLQVVTNGNKQKV